MLNKASRFFGILFITFCLSISFSIASEPAMLAKSTAKDSLEKEAAMTRITLENVLSEARANFQKLNEYRGLYQAKIDTLIQLIHVFRFPIKVRYEYFEKISRLMGSGANTKQMSQYPKEYWENLVHELKAEFFKDQWKMSGDPNEKYNQIMTKLNTLFIKLSEKSPVNSKITEAVMKFLDVSIASELQPGQMIMIQDKLAALTKLLSGYSGWGSDVNQQLTGLVNDLRTAYLILDSNLKTLEESLFNINQEIHIFSDLLEKRLTKLDTLFGALQVIEKNFHRLEEFNPTDIRNHLIFIRNQNLTIEAEHRVLKSFAGKIETAVIKHDCKTILTEISS